MRSRTHFVAPQQYRAVLGIAFCIGPGGRLAVTQRAMQSAHKP